MNNNQNEGNDLNTSFTPENQNFSENNPKDSVHPDFENNENKTPFNDEFSYGSTNETSFETDLENRKKPKFGFIAAAVVIFVLLLGSVYAFANWKTLSNSIALMTKGPLKYYTGIEQKSLNENIDSFTESYSKYIASFQNKKEDGLAQDGTIKLTVNPQFTSLIGLSDFQSLEAKFSTLSKKNQDKASFGFLYNGQSLFNLDTYLNSETNDLYFSIPELSTAYLYFSMADLTENTNGSSTDYAKEVEKFLTSGSLSPEVLNSLLKKYSAIIVDNIDNMVVDKNVKISTGDLSGTYNILTSKLDVKTLNNMARTILNTAKEDEDLKKVFVASGVCTEDQYGTLIENALAEIDSADTDTDSSDFFYFRVYVDNTGKIVGREITDAFDFSLDAEATSFGYYHLAKDNKRGFKLWLKEEGKNVFELNADGSVSSKGFTGNANLSFSNFDSTYSDYANSSIDIAMENVKMSKDGKGSGKFTVTSDMFMGGSIVLDYQGEDKNVNVKLQLLYGGIEAGTLEISATEGKYEDFELPGSSDQIYDGLNDTYSYIQNADLDGFISHLEEVTGQDLRSIFQSLISNSVY